MLELGSLQVEGALAIFAGQAQRVEHTTRVLAPLDVLFSVAVNLSTTHQDRLDVRQLPVAPHTRVPSYSEIFGFLEIRPDDLGCGPPCVQDSLDSLDPGDGF